MVVCMSPCAGTRDNYVIVCVYLSLPICILFCILGTMVQQGGQWHCRES
jgi:hypothetical protein